ncbi:centromere protein H isoform X1 [Pantherophis guttatus]|uniref:Centromere protein H isoform X1 n=1 Tax=Pantherophis guttatus TaxID=94885 RepID=A0A6P9DM24_PANGU|nr:centromere protein H isoform X1 [Pantherophis guttatus]
MEVAGSPEIGDKAAPAAAFGNSNEGVMEEGARLLFNEEKEKTPDLLKLYRIKEQISQHLMEYNTIINSAAAEKIPDQDRNEKILEGSIEELERDLEEMRLSYQNKTLALQRIQITDALRTKLKNEDDDSKFIWDTIKHIMMLSTAILKSKQQSRELEEKLNEVKKSRLELKRTGECKLAQIYDMKRKQKEDLENMEVGEMLKKARKNLQKEIQMTTLVQNIFQNLITGSGVNWAKDPALKTIVLQLEKNMTGI